VVQTTDPDQRLATIASFAKFDVEFKIGVLRVQIAIKNITAFSKK
jgi:hypothetical protein